MTSHKKKRPVRLQGRFHLKMDGKGRIAIPGRLREQLGVRANRPLILTNTDKCLDLFPWKEWEDQVEEIDGLEEHDPDLELYRAWYIGAAQEVHKELGFGFLEVVYQSAFEIEFNNKNIPYKTEFFLPIYYILMYQLEQI